MIVIARSAADLCTTPTVYERWSDASATYSSRCSASENMNELFIIKEIYRDHFYHIMIMFLLIDVDRI